MSGAWPVAAAGRPAGPMEADRPALEPGRLDVWVVRRPRLDEASELLDFSELSEPERARAETFIRPGDAVTYASAHIGLRRLLGAYLGIAPQDVPFVREPCPGCGGPHGRPAVTHPAPPLHFSLAHSHGLAVVAVAATPLGADVERLPRDETVAVCTPALHPDERAEVEEAAPDRRRQVFGQLWTRKEAYLKGIGTGLSREPSQDYLGAATRRRPPGWTLVDIPCGPRHQGSVAVFGAPPAQVGVRWLPLEALYAGGSVDVSPVHPAEREPALAGLAA